MWPFNGGWSLNGGSTVTEILSLYPNHCTQMKLPNIFMYPRNFPLKRKVYERGIRIYIKTIFQDIDADAVLPDERMGEISKVNHDIMEMTEKMDGLKPSSAARSCRDLKMEYPTVPDGAYMMVDTFNIISAGLLDVL